MSDVSIRVEAKKVFAMLREAPAVLFAAIRSGAFNGLEEFRTRHFLKFMRGRPGLIMRHGRAGLGGSARTEVLGDTLETLTATAFFGPPASKYARIHETGGIVRPRTRKYLSIPATGTGPDQRMRDFPGGRFIPRGKGGFYYVQGGKLRFILAKSVQIPPRLNWLSLWDQIGPQVVDKNLDKAGEKAIAKLLS